jgi:hypothetical protein
MWPPYTSATAPTNTTNPCPHPQQRHGLGVTSGNPSGPSFVQHSSKNFLTDLVWSPPGKEIYTLILYELAPISCIFKLKSPDTSKYHIPYHRPLCKKTPKQSISYICKYIYKHKWRKNQQTIQLLVELPHDTKERSITIQSESGKSKTLLLSTNMPMVDC